VLRQPVECAYYLGVLLAIRDSHNRTRRKEDESEPELWKEYYEARDHLEQESGVGDAPEGRFPDLLSWRFYALSPRKD
jgi:hypothetical protein